MSFFAVELWRRALGFRERETRVRNLCNERSYNGMVS
jgi:hypothetical protein